ncbi:hypothetical protein K492DRAFT_17963 [Lichtheimia hyalospora FSU 10163]|nr:hypothetical protein K492DRAFT_17963 [Lichtheimia hyalospora FSU 10163]
MDCLLSIETNTSYRENYAAPWWISLRYENIASTRLISKSYFIHWMDTLLRILLDQQHRVLHTARTTITCHLKYSSMLGVSADKGWIIRCRVTLMGRLDSSKKEQSVIRNTALSTFIITLQVLYCIHILANIQSKNKDEIGIKRITTSCIISAFARELWWMVQCIHIFAVAHSKKRDPFDIRNQGYQRIISHTWMDHRLHIHREKQTQIRLQHQENELLFKA